MKSDRDDLRLLDSLLSIQKFSPDSQILIKNYFIIIVIVTIVATFTNIFVVLYFIDKYDYATAGLLFAVLSFTQFIIDFPSGSLSDLLGQKWIGVIGYIFAGIS